MLQVKLNKCAVAILLFIFLLSAGFCIYFFVSYKKSSTNAHQLLFPLEQFLVRIGEGDIDKYVRLEVLLEFSNEEDLKLAKESEVNIRDIIYEYLHSLNLEDLNRSSSVYFLKEGIALRVNKVLNPVDINDVLFGNFVVG